MRLFVFIFFLLIVCLSCKERTKTTPAEKARKQQLLIDQIVSGIAYENILNGAAVGISGEKTEQWRRYEKLSQYATSQQLIALTNDTNPVVRCYAFDAICERKEIDLYPIVQSHLSDTARVKTYFGCEMGEDLVGHYYASRFFSDTTRHSSKLFNIDSIILYSKTFEWVEKNILLLNFKDLTKENYIRLKVIAFVEKNNRAVVAIAKYHNDKDIPAIRSLLTGDNDEKINCGLLAVANFPDRSFFTILDKMVANELKDSDKLRVYNPALLYMAIVKYKDRSSQELLDKVLNETKGANLIKQSDFIYQAVKENPDPVYDGLRYRHTYF